MHDTSVSSDGKIDAFKDKFNKLEKHMKKLDANLEIKHLSETCRKLENSVADSFDKVLKKK